jgi:hypothetical protein
VWIRKLGDGAKMVEQPKGRGTVEWTLISLLLVQIAASGFFLIIWIFGGKLPGPIAGTLLISGIIFFRREGLLRDRNALIGAVLVTILGLAYPWPWVRLVEETLVFDLDWEKGPAPEGCECVGIIYDDPRLIGEPGSEVDFLKYYFCGEDLSAFYEGVNRDGKVSTSWELTTSHPMIGEPSSFSYSISGAAGLPYSDFVLSHDCYALLEH